MISSWSISVAHSGLHSDAHMQIRTLHPCVFRLPYATVGNNELLGISVTVEKWIKWYFFLTTSAREKIKPNILRERKRVFSSVSKKKKPLGGRHLKDTDTVSLDKDDDSYVLPPHCNHHYSPCQMYLGQHIQTFFMGYFLFFLFFLLRATFSCIHVFLIFFFFLK